MARLVQGRQRREAIGYRKGIPDGQGQQSIQIEGFRLSAWRVNRSKLRATGTDLHRGARDAHARIQPSLVSMVAAQPLRAASVEGTYLNSIPSI